MRRRIKKIQYKLSRNRPQWLQILKNGSPSGTRTTLSNPSWRKFRHFFASKSFWKTASIVLLSSAGVILAVFGYIAKDLPDPNKINSGDTEQTTQILDRNGKKLYSVFGDQNRTVIAFDQIPVNCRNAIIVKEDRDFYKHHGFVPRSIGRAARSDILSALGNKNQIQGGSTITQQLVKNALLTPERSLSRKIKEIVLAIEIEQLYKKDDILKLYMNEIPFGSNAYGIQAAAQTYFGKEAKDLKLEECAAMAVLPQAPTYYSPFGQQKDEALKIKDSILDLMVTEGYIKKEEAEVAKKTTLNFQPPRENILAPHFVLWVRQALVNLYGEKAVYSGGLNVTTTLDYEIQKKAEEAMTANLANMRRNGVKNASFTAIDPKTGQVLAMVGSVDYFDQSIDGNVNVALTQQQPGSSLKPLVYGTLFKQKDRFGRYWSPGSILYDVTTNFGDFGGKGYQPKNFDGRDLHNSSGSPAGAVTIRYALGNSLNIPAVKALYIAGTETVVNQLHDMGYSSPNITASNCGLALVLGGCDVTPLEHTNAYATLADMGVKHELASILKVVDSKGKTIREYKDRSQRVLDAQVAYQVADILRDPAARADEFGRCCFKIKNHNKFGVKTGTSNDDRTGKAVDTWVMGFTPKIAVGVWVGNNRNEPFGGFSGITAEPIFSKFLNAYLADKPDEWYAVPKGIKTVTLDNVTGGTPGEGGGTHNDIAASFFESPNLDKLSSFDRDIVSGGKVTSCTPPEARQQVTSSKIVPEIGGNDPAYGRWLSALARIGASSGGVAPTFDDNVHDCSKPDIKINSAEVQTDGTTKVSYTLAQNAHTITGGTAPGSSSIHFYINGTEIVPSGSPLIGNSGGFSAIFAASTAPSGSTLVIKIYDAVLDSASDTKTVSGGGGGTATTTSTPQSKKKPDLFDLNR